MIIHRRPALLPTMFSNAMYRIETAINVSISGGNHSASGPRLKAEAISVIECATVNEVTMATKARNRRKGMIKQKRKSK